MLASFEVALMLLSTRWKTQVSCRENSKYEKNFVNTFNVTTWGTTFFSSERKYCLESQEGTQFCYSQAVLYYFTLSQFMLCWETEIANFPTNRGLHFKLVLFSIFAQVFKDSVWSEEKVKSQKNAIGWFTQVMEDSLFFQNNLTLTPGISLLIHWLGKLKGVTGLSSHIKDYVIIQRRIPEPIVY